MKKLMIVVLGLGMAFGLSLTGCDKKADDAAAPAADKAAAPAKKAAAPAKKAPAPAKAPAAPAKAPAAAAPAAAPAAAAPAAAMGPNCTALLAKGTQVCNAPDVSKYGAKMIANCLKPYAATAGGGNELKCKMMTPK